MMFTALFRSLLLLLILVSYACTAQEKKVEKQTVEEKHQYTNLLINETSPYLLQHAHNPVNWHAWNDETLKKAEREDKLLLISIGYAACHWCHVMEHESFEDSTIAYIMNEKFICVKVDREERPDVDAIYMDACQLINNSGGWPLNAFALPNGKPIYALTYKPADEWTKVLDYFTSFYPAEKEKAIAQAEQLTLGIANKDLVSLNEEAPNFTKADLTEIWKNWKGILDIKNGGRTGAPKFPMSNNYDYLMRAYYHSGNPEKIDAVKISLNKMMMGGIYDQIGGGFARYSTDAVWKVPHFEKMLYDNAQLASTYAQAYSLSKNTEYEKTTREILEWIATDMTNENGGFYSSLDADTEGKEGQFYIWDEAEFDNLLCSDNELMKRYFSVTKKGNWEQSNILYRKQTLVQFAKFNNVEVTELEQKIEKTKKILLKARNEREKPGLDDKILTSWNSLMLKAYADAYRYLGDKKYLEIALKNANFIKENAIQEDFRINRNYKNGVSNINGFLDDYSFTIEAYIALYQVTFDQQWLDLAKNLTDYTLEHFYDKETGLFFYTSNLDKALVARKKELQDNVIPSSNSSMAKALFLLGDYYNDKKYLEMSETMLNNVKSYIRQYGTYYSNWAQLLEMNVNQPREIAIVGKDAEKIREEMMSYFIPNAIFIGGENESNLELLKGKLVAGETYIYVCQNRVCKMPVKTVTEALKLIFE